MFPFPISEDAADEEMVSCWNHTRPKAGRVFEGRYLTYTSTVEHAEIPARNPTGTVRSNKFGGILRAISCSSLPPSHPTSYASWCF
jgi:hypothetical protein